MSDDDVAQDYPALQCDYGEEPNSGTTGYYSRIQISSTLY